MKGEAFPSPDKLLRIGMLLGLAFEQLVTLPPPSAVPIVSFRKKSHRKTKDVHLDNARETGELLKRLVSYLPKQELTHPPTLKDPSSEYAYVQTVATQLRKEMQLEGKEVIEFSDLIAKFNELHAVIIPALWGGQQNHGNALNIHLQLLTKEVGKLRHPAAGAPRRRFGRREPKADAEVVEIAGKLEHYLEVAKGEITRLDYIVTQFLQAIRPSPSQLAPGSLNEVARETLELLRPELENRGLHLKEKLAPRLPLAPLDALQMKQVLVNLIKNAMQAMTRGGVLGLQTGSASDWVWVDVSDTGGGIGQDKINHIFEPFYTTKKKGTGLGLMIVQRIVRQHGGHIELESRVGQGTTFRIRLPLHERQLKLLEATKNETAN